MVRKSEGIGSPQSWNLCCARCSRKIMGAMAQVQARACGWCTIPQLMTRSECASSHSQEAFRLFVWLYFKQAGTMCGCTDSTSKTTAPTIQICVSFVVTDLDVWEASPTEYAIAINIEMTKHSISVSAFKGWWPLCAVYWQMGFWVKKQPVMLACGSGFHG